MRRTTLSAIILLLNACAVTPQGPSVMVLPGTAKSFEEFQADNYNCQQYALGQAGGITPNQAAVNKGLATAAIGTAIGAAAGAALNGGQGAAVGSGIGLATGSVIGASAANDYGDVSQERFDVAYIQCMYAKGHRVPVSGQFSNEPNQQPASIPSNIPPPPAGLPPPPPPR